MLVFFVKITVYTCSTNNALYNSDNDNNDDNNNDNNNDNALLYPWSKHMENLLVRKMI